MVMVLVLVSEQGRAWLPARAPGPGAAGPPVRGPTLEMAALVAASAVGLEMPSARASAGATGPGYWSPRMPTRPKTRRRPTELASLRPPPRTLCAFPGARQYARPGAAVNGRSLTERKRCGGWNLVVPRRVSSPGRLII